MKTITKEKLSNIIRFGSLCDVMSYYRTSEGNKRRIKRYLKLLGLSLAEIKSNENKQHKSAEKQG